MWQDRQPSPEDDKTVYLWLWVMVGVIGVAFILMFATCAPPPATHVVKSGPNSTTR